jgi:hypothetical protein
MWKQCLGCLKNLPHSDDQCADDKNLYALVKLKRLSGTDGRRTANSGRSLSPFDFPHSGRSPRKLLAWGVLAELGSDSKARIGCRVASRGKIDRTGWMTLSEKRLTLHDNQ